jgi:hypothetical protein
MLKRPSLAASSFSQPREATHAAFAGRMHSRSHPRGSYQNVPSHCRKPLELRAWSASSTARDAAVQNNQSSSSTGGGAGGIHRPLLPPATQRLWRSFCVVWLAIVRLTGKAGHLAVRERFGKRATDGLVSSSEAVPPSDFPQAAIASRTSFAIGLLRAGIVDALLPIGRRFSATHFGPGVGADADMPRFRPSSLVAPDTAESQVRFRLPLLPRR